MPSGPPAHCNRSVKKLKPSQPYQGTSKNDTSSKQHSDERMALKALENAMDDSILTTYKKMSKEGYDIDSDPLYNIWSKLTKAVCDTTTVTTIDSAFNLLLTIVSDLLKLPEPKQTKSVTKGTTMLPKHSSSQEMIQFLEEKKREKVKRRRRKRQRKAEREQKKKKQKEQKKEYDKQKAETVSIRLGKKGEENRRIQMFAV